MFDQRLLDKSLAAAGCKKHGTLTYDVPSPNPKLTWTLSFRLLGVYRWDIDGAVRATHATSTPFARRCLAQFAGRWWSDAVAKHPEIVSGIGFPITNLTNWTAYHSLRIKDMSHRESAERITNDVKQYVLPFVASIADDSAYLDHVIADKLPMRWLYCQPLTRFAEAVKLSVEQKMSLTAVKEALDRERAFAKGQLQDFQLEEYVASVFRAASDA